MQQTVKVAVTAGAVIACIGLVPAAAQTNTSAAPGAVIQTNAPPVPQRVSVPPLHLTDAQRAQIRQALKSEDTEVSFALKNAKPSQNFTPAVGAKLPAGLKILALPQPLAAKMPALKRYTYVKFKHQVLLVNPMNRKIVDVLPEDQS